MFKMFVFILDFLLGLSTHEFKWRKRSALDELELAADLAQEMNYPKL